MVEIKTYSPCLDPLILSLGEVAYAHYSTCTLTSCARLMINLHMA